MKITEHRLEECAFSASPNVGGTIVPRVIVMHYTATWDAASAIRTLTDGSRGDMNLSAHIVVGPDGAITQLVPFCTKAWHAGSSGIDLPSGRLSGLNSHSIGIEIVNAGYLRRNEAGEYFDSGGRNVTARLNGTAPIQAPWDRVGSGPLYWPIYPEAQLDAIEDLTRALLKAYPSIECIVGHSDITTRKSDPGPAFPLARFQRLLTNRANDDDDIVVGPLPTPAPLPNNPLPQNMPTPQPPARPLPPATQSRTIWGAVVAFVVGILAFLRELFTDPANVWDNMKTSFMESYGFNPVWLLAGVFSLAIALVIFARLDDRAKLRR